MPWTWPPPEPLVPNQQQSSTPPCPGAAPCHPDAPHANPSHQGPLPCPQTPELCRLATGRAPGGHAHTEATPPDQEPPETRPTAPGTPKPPHYPSDTPPCFLPAARRRPVCSRAARTMPRPPVPPHCPSSPRAIKAPPRPLPCTTPSPHPTPSPRSYPERSSELHFEQLGHRAAPPLQLTAGDASGTQTQPRSPAVDHRPHRRRSPPAGASPAVPLCPCSLSPSGWRRRPWAVDREINGPG